MNVDLLKAMFAENKNGKKQKYLKYLVSNIKTFNSNVHQFVEYI